MKVRMSRLEVMMQLGLIHCNTDGEGGGGSVGGEVPAAVDGGSTPAVDTSTSETPADSGAGEIDWGEIMNEHDEEPQEPVAEATETPAEPVVPEATETPAEPQAAQAEASETPPVVPPVEEVAPVTEEPAAPEATAQTPEQQAAAQAEARSTWVTDLTSRYQLTDEQSDLMRTEPEKVLPQLAAEMHAQVTESLMQVQRSMLPQMVDNIIKQQTTQKAGDKAFFDEWPELEAHRPLVQSMGQHWRTQNPSGTREDFIKEVGPLVWSAAKLSLQDLVNRGNVTPPAATPPAAQQSGYAPAQSGGGGGVETPVADANTFGALAEEWETD